MTAPGHFSVHAADSSAHSEETAKSPIAPFNAIVIIIS